MFISEYMFAKLNPWPVNPKLDCAGSAGACELLLEDWQRFCSSLNRSMNTSLCILIVSSSCYCARAAARISGLFIARWADSAGANEGPFAQRIAIFDLAA